MRIAGILQPGTVLNYVLEAKHVKAGLIVVQTIEERDKILDENRDSLVNGTPIYVAETHKTYRYNEEQNTFIPDLSFKEDENGVLCIEGEGGSLKKIKVEVGLENLDPTLREKLETLSSQVDDLSNALHFIGVETELPESGEDGDVVIIGTKEYVWAENVWHELGDESSHLTKTEAAATYVPLTRTINGHPLSATVTLSSADIGDLGDTISTAIRALDTYTVSVGVGETISAISQTDGVVSVTKQTISITQAQVSGLSTTLSTFATTTALNNKIASLDKTDSAVDNQYVTAVSETDGVISVIRKQISYNELADKPTIPTSATGKLLDAAGTEIFNTNQSTNDTVVCIDGGSATELID